MTASTTVGRRSSTRRFVRAFASTVLASAALAWSGAGSAAGMLPPPPDGGVPSGASDPIPLGDVSGWHQVFAEGFATRAPLGSFSGCVTGLGILKNSCSGLAGGPYAGWWSAYPGGWKGTPATGTYFPSRTLSVHGGVLDYYLHSASGKHMIAAVVPKLPGGPDAGGLLYGRYLVRARWDPLSSYSVSFLLWPDSGRWPADGEIDFPEANMAAAQVEGFMHWQGTSSPDQQDQYSVTADAAQWHVYELDWLPDSLSFLIDGRLVGRSTEHVPDTPMHWVLQTNTSPSITRGDTSAGHVQIDWAVAYTPAQ